MPESFRVKLVNPEQFDIVASAFVGRAGVDQVQDQKALLEKFFKVLNWVQWFAGGLALLMILVSVILIVNTIRVAAFSRRRETGIMKLVGASNFSIQLPFLLEGAISGFLGAALATGAFVLIKGAGRQDPGAELPDHPVHHLGRRLAQRGSGVRHRRGAGRNRQLVGPGQVPRV
jgi:cell division transport system permease protein